MAEKVVVDSIVDEKSATVNVNEKKAAVTNSVINFTTAQNDVANAMKSQVSAIAAVNKNSSESNKLALLTANQLVITKNMAFNIANSKLIEDKKKLKDANITLKSSSKRTNDALNKAKIAEDNYLKSIASKNNADKEAADAAARVNSIGVLPSIINTSTTAVSNFISAFTSTLSGFIGNVSGL